jgi:hypothetical protein
MRTKCVLLASVAASLSLSLHLASPAEAGYAIATFDSSRIQSTNGVNFTFHNSPFYDVARGLLINTSFHGASGVNTVVSMSTITTAGLANTDAFVLPLLTNGSAGLSSAEKSALTTYVTNGGGLFVFSNRAASDDLQGIVNITAGGFSTQFSSSAARVVNSSSPLLTGPGGTLASNATFSGVGFGGSIAAVGTGGALAVGLTGGPYLAATYTLGSGHIVVFTDEEIFMSTRRYTDGVTFTNTVSGTVNTAALTINFSTHAVNTNTGRLFLNAFEYALPSAPRSGQSLVAGGFALTTLEATAVPEPSSFVSGGIGAAALGIGLAFRRRLRRSADAA